MWIEIGSGELMISDVWNARRFGAHDKPPCPNCGNPTFLARRSPVSDYALHLERQTFTCLECNLDFERVVDGDGRPLRNTELTRS
jgi:ribosomal protein S27AE